jgi:hypothetical protein
MRFGDREGRKAEGDGKRREDAGEREGEKSRQWMRARTLDRRSES